MPDRCGLICASEAFFSELISRRQQRQLSESIIVTRALLSFFGGKYLVTETRETCATVTYIIVLVRNYGNYGLHYFPHARLQYV